MQASVVTPFHNTEDYLEECIQSVLVQTLEDFEYILQDNLSTDRSGEIAQDYAARDSRIRFVTNDTLLTQVRNYNRALSRISPSSKWCKLVQADDWIYPTCLEEMTQVGEISDDVRIVTSYRLKGRRVLGGENEPRPTIISGREACRRLLLNDDDVFGSPTTILYRSDIVRARQPFYALDSDSEDTEACFEILREGNLGFVPQILSYSRMQEGSILSGLSAFQPVLLNSYLWFHRYGPEYLSEQERKHRRRVVATRYQLFLGGAFLTGRPKPFWQYHRERLASVGKKISSRDLAVWAVRSLLFYVTCPRKIFERSQWASRR